MVSRCFRILVIVELDKMNLIYTCLELDEVNLLEPITKPKNRDAPYYEPILLQQIGRASCRERV